MNLQGVAEAELRVDDDYIVFLDGGSTGAGKKESVVDFASALAGTGLTSSSGELQTTTRKYTRSFEWGTDISGVSFNVGNTIVTLTHSLASSYVLVSVKDVDGVIHNEAASSTGNHLLDIDYDVMIKVIDTNSISLELNISGSDLADLVTNSNEFQVTVIG